jgi:hypothetical protein
VLTLVHQRQHCSQKVLAELLEINPHSIGEAIADTRQPLDEHGHTTSPTTTRFTTVAALSQLLTTGAVPTARPRVAALWSDPALTGMPRAHLASLIERLSVHQAAQAERVCITAVAANAYPEPAGVCSLKRSPTPNVS